MKRKRFIIYSFVVLLIGMGGVGLASHFHSSKAEGILTAQPVLAIPSVYELWQLTNAERTKAGLAPLVLDAKLNQSASAKCSDMVATGWGHVDPQGRHGYHFIQEVFPDATKYGENLAEQYNVDSDIMTAWMNSPPHKAAILDPAYTDIGFGVCNAKGIEYTVQHFAGL
jgi:uncharacterized protein YkwD